MRDGNDYRAGFERLKAALANKLQNSANAETVGMMFNNLKFPTNAEEMVRLEKFVGEYNPSQGVMGINQASVDRISLNPTPIQQAPQMMQAPQQAPVIQQQDFSSRPENLRPMTPPTPLSVPPLNQTQQTMSAPIPTPPQPVQTPVQTNPFLDPNLTTPMQGKPAAQFNPFDQNNLPPLQQITPIQSQPNSAMPTPQQTTQINPDNPFDMNITALPMPQQQMQQQQSLSSPDQPTQQQQGNNPYNPFNDPAPTPPQQQVTQQTPQQQPEMATPPAYSEQDLQRAPQFMQQQVPQQQRTPPIQSAERVIQNPGQSASREVQQPYLDARKQVERDLFLYKEAAIKTDPSKRDLIERNFRQAQDSLNDPNKTEVRPKEETDRFFESMVGIVGQDKRQQLGMNAIPEATDLPPIPQPINTRNNSPQTTDTSNNPPQPTMVRDQRQQPEMAPPPAYGLQEFVAPQYRNFGLQNQSERDSVARGIQGNIMNYESSRGLVQPGQGRNNPNVVYHRQAALGRVQTVGDLNQRQELLQDIAAFKAQESQLRANGQEITGLVNSFQAHLANKYRIDPNPEINKDFSGRGRPITGAEYADHFSQNYINRLEYSANLSYAQSLGAGMPGLEAQQVPQQQSSRSVQEAPHTVVPTALRPQQPVPQQFQQQQGAMPPAYGSDEFHRSTSLDSNMYPPQQPQPFYQNPYPHSQGNMSAHYNYQQGMPVQNMVPPQQQAQPLSQDNAMKVLKDNKINLKPGCQYQLIPKVDPTTGQVTDYSIMEYKYDKKGQLEEINPKKIVHENGVKIGGLADEKGQQSSMTFYKPGTTINGRPVTKTMQNDNSPLPAGMTGLQPMPKDASKQLAKGMQAALKTPPGSYQSTPQTPSQTPRVPPVGGDRGRSFT